MLFVEIQSFSLFFLDKSSKFEVPKKNASSIRLVVIGYLVSTNDFKKLFDATRELGEKRA